MGEQFGVGRAQDHVSMDFLHPAEEIRHLARRFGATGTSLAITLFRLTISISSPSASRASTSLNE
jgi:hypothetical protein